MKAFYEYAVPNGCVWLYLKLTQQHPEWTITDIKNYLLNKNMSNKQNEIIQEDAVEFVDRMMESNPTIPPEAREQLIIEEINKRMEKTIEEEGYEHYE